MLIETLISQSSVSTDAMRLLEKEVERLVAEPTLVELSELVSSPKPAVNLYLCKVLELRIIRGVTSRSLLPEIEFSTRLIHQTPTYHACKVHSLLGLFCWPAEMPNFLTDVASLLNTRAGYQMFLMFLEKVNTSTYIDDKRRSELKKAIGIVFKELQARFSDTFADLIIPIFTELTKVIPLNYDWSLVLRAAGSNQAVAVDFFTEAFNHIDSNHLVGLLDQFSPDCGVLNILSYCKMKNINNKQAVYEYVFKCLVEDVECFSSAVEFWQKIFSSKEHASVLKPVLREVTKAHAQVEEEVKEDADAYYFGFLSIVAKNYPEISAEYLISDEPLPPMRITASFLNKIAKSGTEYLKGVSFDNSYLNVLVSFLRNDSATPSLIGALDFSDKDSVKLILQIMAKYEFTREQVEAILRICENGNHTISELKVECLSRLNIHGSFDVNWSMAKVIEYYYFLKRDRMEYLKYKDSFYSLFIQSAPFDRCFSIVNMIGDIPNVILQNIYDNLSKYPYVELSCFNNDLLSFLNLEVQKPFLEKEVARFVEEWLTFTERREYYQALKSLINIFGSKIDLPGYVDLMLDLVQIDYSFTLNRLIAIFNGYKGMYNTRKAVFMFISAYNASNLEASQSQLSGALTTCLYQPDGPAAFSEILGLDMAKLCDIRMGILKVNRKTAQNIVRNLIKDFKGKALRNLYSNEIKVTKQDFLRERRNCDSD
ncbi:hypothetical protein PAEPH01_0345 [Pancytospora epiphaga]|nr:hypothetical protein PAEPH01_0345 [Pancytospora epiphaga]